jgi:hypothetical protein
MSPDKPATSMMIKNSVVERQERQVSLDLMVMIGVAWERRVELDNARRPVAVDARLLGVHGQVRGALPKPWPRTRRLASLTAEPEPDP